jgi:cold-inducible RNA-binding protein
VPTNQKTTSNKRQREQDQKERAAERSARRTERKARAAARLASGQVGPQIAEPAPPERDVLPNDPAAASAMPPAMGAPRSRPDQSATTRRLYVGNLSYNMDANSIASLFAQHGEVSDVHIVLDQVSRRPRGFAFVTMGSPAEAQAAITSLDGQNIDGRTLRVNQAEARESGPSMGRGRY